MAPRLRMVRERLEIERTRDDSAIALLNEIQGIARRLVAAGDGLQRRSGRSGSGRRALCREARNATATSPSHLSRST